MLFDKWKILTEKIDAIQLQIDQIHAQQKQLQRRKSNLNIQKAQQKARDMNKPKH